MVTEEYDGWVCAYCVREEGARDGNFHLYSNMIMYDSNFCFLSFKMLFPNLSSKLIHPKDCSGGQFFHNVIVVKAL